VVLAAVVEAAAAEAAVSGGRDTLRPTADATWRPEMNYGRFGVPYIDELLFLFVKSQALSCHRIWCTAAV